MERRQVLRATGGASLLLLAGCAADSKGSDSTTPSPSPTPTPSEPNPSIVRFITLSPGDFTGPNLVAFGVGFDKLQKGVEYRLVAIVEFDSDTSRGATTFTQEAFGLGAAQVRVQPPEGTSTDSQYIEYEVRLMRDGEVLTTRDGSVLYE